MNINKFPIGLIIWTDTIDGKSFKIEKLYYDKNNSEFVYACRLLYSKTLARPTTFFESSIIQNFKYSVYQLNQLMSNNKLGYCISTIEGKY